MEVRVFDKEWWVRRTRQAIDKGVYLTIEPNVDGGWYIYVFGDGEYDSFGPVFSEREFQEQLWQARLWCNRRYPEFEGATYDWPNPESIPYEW